MFELRWLIIVDKFKSISATGLPENREKRVLQYRNYMYKPNPPHTFNPEGGYWGEWRNVPETRITSKEG